MSLHTVAQGDCISSIAKQYGVPWDAVWNHPDNAALKEKRKDPNVLYPGDTVTVPDRNIDFEACATDQRHQFVMKAEKAKLRLRILQADKPRAGEAYRLEIDGFAAASGKIDANGYVTQPLPPGASSGKLYVGSGLTQDVYKLSFGVLDPIDTREGVSGRLVNLGYGADNIEEALKAFQEKEKLPITGEADDATRARLVSRFGQ
jgi:hypothetical protein